MKVLDCQHLTDPGSKGSTYAGKVKNSILNLPL